MKLAISNIGFLPQEETAAYLLMQKYGFSGLEIAPTRLLGTALPPYEDLSRAQKAAKELQHSYGLVIPSLQSIWYGRTENLFDPEGAAALEAYTKNAVAFAVAVGCPSLVLGCPRHRNMPQGKHPEDAAAFFTAIALHARENSCAIALEANPAVYGTNFCNTSAQAFAFAKAIPHLKVNYDVGTLLTNGESLQTLAENLPMVSHVHLSAPALAAIEANALHGELAAVLRKGGYEGYVSVEMQAQPLSTVERVLAYTAEVFA